VIYPITRTDIFADWQAALAQMMSVIGFILLAAFAVYAQTSVSLTPDEKTLIIEDAKESDVFAFGKNVIVKQNAKGVLAFGGDVIVEGRVEGDVATIGGSIVQKETAFIGGDVIAFGGTYHHDSANPLRNAGKETIMYAGYEEELRNLTQNPSQLFAPSFTLSFLAQRLLLLLVWFVTSLVITTIAPGAVSRAVARFQLSTLKVVAFGFVGFVVAIAGVMISLSFLPSYIYAILILMAIVFFILSFVFGRVALQVSVGKKLQKLFLDDDKHSETLALLIGAFVWTLLLSIPYLWTIALIALVVISFGLVLTARSTNGWQKS
jgi:MFS family permease